MTKENRSGLETCPWLNLEELYNATLLITGGTGLVGANLLKELAPLRKKLNLRLVALVRNKEKAQRVFSSFSDEIELLSGDVCEKIEFSDPIDYIIHGASITSSRTFVEKPVETVLTSVEGVRNLLELAREKKVRSMVYLSSMEIYGTVNEDKLLTEKDLGFIDPLSVRSSYPESKRLCETLCASYASEYGVPVRIARLAQTFGPGMPPEDQRAVVQFLQSAIKGKNIEIRASGESARMYLFTFDAACAILTLLLSGENGKAYNVANKETYASIRALAETIVSVTESKSQVLVNTGTEEEKKMYPPDSFLRLDTSALESLGWQAQYDLTESIRNLKKYMEEIC